VYPALSEPARVFIVEDNPHVAQSLANMLQNEGYRVEHFSTGRAALREIALAPPDLILLDLWLPDIHGQTICATLKADEATRLIPILIISASDERAAQLQVLAAGADGYLRKPADEDELRARVGALLRAKRHNDTLERPENVIFALAATVEAKDTYTEGHLRRLGYYSVAIAEQIGLSGAALTAVRYGALLHDVGKVGIDEAIIRKGGPLTADEYQVMQQHTLIGDRIVAPLRLAAAVGPIVRGHHERWDGQGYPDGLAGEAIPLGARIVAVADAFDAMTTQRPYNLVKSVPDALACLRDGAGTSWDPQVVAAFALWAEQHLVEHPPLQERVVGGA
jgi:putative two-component system response regulator